MVDSILIATYPPRTYTTNLIEVYQIQSPAFHHRLLWINHGKKQRVEAFVLIQTSCPNSLSENRCQEKDLYQWCGVVWCGRPFTLISLTMRYIIIGIIKICFMKSLQLPRLL